MKKIIGFRTKVEAVVVSFFLLIVVVSGVFALTRTITDDSDDVSIRIEMINSTANKYYEATADDLQQAIHDLNNASGVVHVPYINFSASQTIDLISGLTLVIDGVVSLADSSNCNIFSAVDCTDIHLNVNEIYGNKNNQNDGYGIYFENCQDSSIDVKKVRYVNKTGLRIVNSQNMTIEADDVAHCGSHGISLYHNLNNSYLRAKSHHNGYDNMDGSGVFFRGNCDNNIIIVEVFNNALFGLDFGEGSDNNNFVVTSHHNVDSGVYMGNGANGNTGTFSSFENGDEGIYIQTCEDFSFDCTVRDNDGIGIKIDEDFNFSISAVCTGNGANGLNCYSNSANGTITGVFSDNGRSAANTYYGIKLDDVTGINVVGVTAKDSGKVKFQKRGIHETGTSDYNFITSCDTRNNLVDDSINIVGSHTRVVNCVGFITEDGHRQVNVDDKDTISHNLSGTPTYVVCTSATENCTVSVTALAASTFTVALKSHDGSAVTGATVYWRAYYIP